MNNDKNQLSQMWNHSSPNSSQERKSLLSHAVHHCLLLLLSFWVLFPSLVLKEKGATRNIRSLDGSNNKPHNYVFGQIENGGGWLRESFFWFHLIGSNGIVLATKIKAFIFPFEFSDQHFLMESNATSAGILAITPLLFTSGPETREVYCQEWGLLLGSPLICVLLWLLHTRFLKDFSSFISLLNFKIRPSASNTSAYK